MGAALFLLFFVISLSGLTLGWKKNSNGMILPKTQKGTTSHLEEWLPFSELHKIAVTTLHDSVDKNLSIELERIDARPEKGIVKFVFIDGYWGIQLDGATGKVLSIERRRHDFIENIHDGSILDYIFKTDGEILKLIYTSIMGTSLFLFTVTGFWMWYGPKVMRGKRGKHSK